MTQLADKPAAQDLDKSQRIDLLHQMMLIRRFEEKAAEMYAKQRIAGFLHLYIGQEAVAAGAMAALRGDDYIVSHYRDHGHALARGLDPRRVMAELFGRETGVSHGKGGSMHLFDAEHNFVGGYAIVAGHMPLACGLGLACRQLHNDRLAICIFGDGAVNEGEFHESLNLAAVWKLPVIFLCENNFYGMGTDIRRVSAVIEVYKRAEAYAIPAEQVDGMDVLAMYEATQRAARHIRSGKGPVFLEAITYRFRGHSMADPEFYRRKDEVQHWRARDPIVSFRRQLEQASLIEEATFQRLQADVEDAVNEAVRFAEESPKPPPEALYRDVYRGEGS